MLLWILRHLTRSLVSFSHHNLKKVITFELRRLPHKALWGHVTVTKRIAISRYWLYYTVSVGRCVGDDPWRNLDAKLKSKILFSLKMYRLIVEMIIHTTYQNQIVIYLTVAILDSYSFFATFSKASQSVNWYQSFVWRCYCMGFVPKPRVCNVTARNTTYTHDNWVSLFGYLPLASLGQSFGNYFWEVENTTKIDQKWAVAGSIKHTCY